MKKMFTLLAVVCMTMTAYADLVVDTTGNVMIDGANLTVKSTNSKTVNIAGDAISFSNGISLKAPTTYPTLSFTNNFSDVTYNGIYNQYAFAVASQNRSTALFYNGTNYIYPVITSYAIFSNPANYLYVGKSGTSGNTVFYVTSDGGIYSVYSPVTLSDVSHKSNITTVTNALDGLRYVNPVSYSLNVDGTTTPEVANTVSSMTLSLDDESDIAESIPTAGSTVDVADDEIQAIMKAERNRPKYGFIAQEIEEIFPNVVYTLPNGEKAIAYQEIIPILVSAIQELQAQVDTLKADQMPVDIQQHAPAALQEAVAEGNVALMQNTPNPFNQATEIGYRLPQGTATALIMVCDLNGKMLQSYPLATNTTEGVLTLQAGSYTPGIYLYTLLVDGVRIDTKQMIILAK